MNRGQQLVVVRIAPTRDGLANPSERLPDKHSRLFCGRTLDEWWAIQSWASKHISTSILVGENQAHFDRLTDLLMPYGITVLARPESMNHPTQDSGGFPCRFGYQWAKRHVGNINCVITDFVVSPLRKPDDYDRIIEAFCEKMSSPNPDAVSGIEQMTSASKTDYWYGAKSGDRLIPLYLSDVPNGRWWPTYVGVGTLGVLSPRAYEAVNVAGDLHLPAIPNTGPWLFETEEWQEVHIDRPDEWDLAEFWFQKKIGGIEAYEQYRRSWHGAGD